MIQRSQNLRKRYGAVISVVISARILAVSGGHRDALDDYWYVVKTEYMLVLHSVADL